MKAFKAFLVFLSLLMMWPVPPEAASRCLWINGAVVMALAAVAIFLYRKNRLPCWSWAVVWFFAGWAKAIAEGHPMHTDMSVFEHYVRCYGAAFSGFFGVWLLPCCNRFRTLSFDSFLPLLFVVITAALYWKKRIRPFRILFAIALCFWLLCGISVLMIWK